MDVHAEVPRFVEKRLGVATRVLENMPFVHVHFGMMIVDLHKYLVWKMVGYGGADAWKLMLGNL